DPLANPRIAPAVRLKRLEQGVPIKETPQTGQIHRLMAKSKCPGRPKRSLVGRVAIRACVTGVVLVLEQLLRHNWRPRVEPIGWRPTIERPDDATVSAHRRLERWRALRIDDHDGHAPGRGLDEQADKRRLP